MYSVHKYVIIVEDTSTLQHCTLLQASRSLLKSCRLHKTNTQHTSHTCNTCIITLFQHQTQNNSKTHSAHIVIQTFHFLATCLAVRSVQLIGAQVLEKLQKKVESTPEHSPQAVGSGWCIPTHYTYFLIQFSHYLL